MVGTATPRDSSVFATVGRVNLRRHVNPDVVEVVGVSFGCEQSSKKQREHPLREIGDMLTRDLERTSDSTGHRTRCASGQQFQGRRVSFEQTEQIDHRRRGLHAAPFVLGSIPTSPRPTAAWWRCATPGAAGRPSCGASSSATGAAPCACSTSAAPSAPSTRATRPTSAVSWCSWATPSERRRRRRCASAKGPVWHRPPFTATTTVRGPGPSDGLRRQAARYCDQDSISALRFSKRSLRA